MEFTTNSDLSTQYPALGTVLRDLAVVDDPGDLRPQILAVDNPVHEPVLEQELAGLEPFRQLQPHGVPDRPLAGEPDHRTGLGDGDVALEGPARGYPAHRRI